MRNTFARDTEYHVSPYYLGVEPMYRLDFISNTWTGSSDLLVSPLFTKKIQMSLDVIHSAKMGRKLSSSRSIFTKKVTDPYNRPIGTSAPAGYIWKTGSSPEMCPDGFWPGRLDDFGVPVQCIQCTYPKNSMNGECDNVKVSHMSMGSTLEFNPDASYYLQTPQSEFDECTQAAALCLGIDPAYINETDFTLEAWMNVSGNGDYCRKAGLYCMGICRCESYCVTSDIFILGYIFSYGIVGFVIFICFCCICRESRIYVTVRDGVNNSQCMGDEVSHPCNYEHNFCRVCGAHTQGGLDRMVPRATVSP